MHKKIRSLNIIASSLLISSVVSAKPVTVKDWTLDDTGASCVAFTNRTVGGQQYRFELSLDKSGVFPVEAWVREVPSTATTKAFRITTEVKPIQSFGFAPVQDASGNLSFWQVPTDTNALISYIKRQTRLMVHALIPNGAAVPVSKAVDFSLRGSSDIVDSLISNCNRGLPLVQSDFEKSFVPAQTAQLNPLTLDESEAAQLRALYQNSIVVNSQKLALQKDLGVLNTRYAKQIQELGKLTGALDQLTQKELTSLQNRKASIEAKIIQLDQQLKDQQVGIDSKESEVVVANGFYDESSRVLAPLVPEYDRLSEALRVSRSDLSRSQARLSDIDASLQDKNNKIASYERELSVMRSQLSQAQYDIEAARTDVYNTDRDFRRFDARDEYQDRLRRHPVTRYCRESRNNICENLLNRVANQADAEVTNVRNRLSMIFDWAQGNLTQRQSVAAQLDSRIRSYEYEIPSLRSQISDLYSQRPAAESSVIRFRDDVSAKSGALQAYDQRVGYSPKKADVESKRAVVINLQKQLASLEQAKNAALKNREQQTRDLAATDRGIQDVLAKIQAGQERSSELNQALIPYFEEKTRLQSAVAQAEAVIQNNKQEFALIISAL